MSLPDTQVMELYSQGDSCAEVAKADGCSETSMYHRMKSLGIIMRSRSMANKVFPDFVFILLYNIGLSVSQTGSLLGVDASTVTKRLHSMKYPLRSRDVAFRIRYTNEEFRKHFMIPEVINKLTHLVENSNKGE